MGLAQLPATPGEPPKASPEVARLLAHTYQRLLALFEVAFLKAQREQQARAQRTQQQIGYDAMAQRQQLQQHQQQQAQVQQAQAQQQQAQQQQAQAQAQAQTQQQRQLQAQVRALQAQNQQHGVRQPYPASQPQAFQPVKVIPVHLMPPDIQNVIHFLPMSRERLVSSGNMTPEQAQCFVERDRAAIVAELQRLTLHYNQQLALQHQAQQGQHAQKAQGLPAGSTAPVIGGGAGEQAQLRVQAPQTQASRPVDFAQQPQQQQQQQQQQQGALRGMQPRPVSAGPSAQLGDANQNASGPSTAHGPQQQQQQQTLARFSQAKVRMPEAGQILKRVREDAAQKRPTRQSATVAEQDRVMFHSELNRLLLPIAELDRNLERYLALSENLHPDALTKILQIHLILKDQKKLLDETPPMRPPQYILSVADLKGSKQFIAHHLAHMHRLQQQFAQFVQNQQTLQQQQAQQQQAQSQAVQSQQVQPQPAQAQPGPPQQVQQPQGPPQQCRRRDRRKCRRKCRRRLRLTCKISVSSSATGPPSSPNCSDLPHSTINSWRFNIRPRSSIPRRPKLLRPNPVHSALR
ncbi:hypothetical protein BS47DRAFT_411524 [Hydnum rufescens UP504]|uniref:Uncharacterized protein n=1 Tax=Hydnum rufescens UP504 TaxID=1448309 RepID=A0A9P6BAR8_9AGAM|nr:hypothetical protein BS47DRAFT_411524 [Hydnum rufescens UP504]